MIPLLRALAILTCMVALLVLLAKSGTTPVPVSVQWNTTTLSTTAPVAITFGLLVLFITYYFGRLTAWLLNLPATIRAYIQGRRVMSTWEALTQGFASLAMGEKSAAIRIANTLRPAPHERGLVTLLKLQTGELTETEAQSFLTDPTLGPLINLHFARHHARAGKWRMVRTYTTPGLALNPSQPVLNTLHFKALLNLGEDEAAVSFLPNIKPQLTRNTYQLLSTIIAAGITTPHAAALSHPWVRAFQKWLPTPSETFPDEPKTPSR